jgi:hypothetical protein
MIGSVSYQSMAPVAAALQAPAATTQRSAQPSAPAWATISRSGEVLSKLQELGASDPAKLQGALAHVSQDLQASARNATGAKADALNDLASRFAQAASSGDLSALGAHRHRHAQASPALDAASGGAVAGPPGASSSSASDSAAQGLLANVLNQMDEAMGMNPPPFGPWFTAQ